METFKIVTDSTADLPEKYLKDHEIDIINIRYVIDDVSYGTDKQMEVHAFYELMRGGKMPTTSQVNPEEAKEFFLSCSRQNKEILCLAFSSGLSGTYNNMRIAANEVMEEQKDIKILVVDTLCASMGEGLLVHKAAELRKEGKSLQETADWLEEHKLNLVHMFTVDDLNHLYRGGRVSKTAAIVGTLAGIKPILHVDDEGHLIPLRNVRGRKKSLLALVDDMEKKIGSYRDSNDIVFISHGDCQADAEFVKEEVKKRLGIETFLINPIGPTIGAHSGPGTVALFFMGDER